MWIQGSTLSISQRALLPERSLSPRQVRAQALANQLIQSYSSRGSVRDALLFIEEHAQASSTLDGDVLSLSLPPSTLSSLGIPCGFGVKGGAAREALILSMSLRAPHQPRDIDLVRRGTHPTQNDEVVAKAIMGRDFEQGARVEIIRDLSHYLRSRDLSINEVTAIDDVVHTSLLCALDTIGHVLRPSRYRSGTLHKRPSLLGTSLLKMVRLYAEGVAIGENWSITGIPEEVSFSEFDLAIHLNKAFERDITVADRFLHTLELLSLLPAADNRVDRALRELEHLRHGEKGLFPNVPRQHWERVLEGDGPRDI
jgi:hypothetical protein